MNVLNPSICTAIGNENAPWTSFICTRITYWPVNSKLFVSCQSVVTFSPVPELSFLPAPI